MADHIRYDLLTQQALRAVVRNVLLDVTKKGLLGEHHFYISFDTKAEGARLSQRLRAQYPAPPPECLALMARAFRRGRNRIDEGVKGSLFLGMVPPSSGHSTSCKRQLCSGCSGRVSGLKNHSKVLTG